MEDSNKPRYKPVNLQQDAFVPLCFDKQILPGTFEYALHHLLEHTVDLSAFDAHDSNHTLGARAYHPKVLLKLVLFGYAHGPVGSPADRARLPRERTVHGAWRGGAIRNNEQGGGFGFRLEIGQSR